MRKKFSRALVAGLLFAVITSAVYFGGRSVLAQENTITASELVQEIQSGWNLGNTLDSITYTRSHDASGTETAWGNLETTAEMIQAVADAGFDAVRVPVTYYDNCDADANIDEAWLDRVEEVVNYVLDAGLYCIIDVHHDTGTGAWITANASDYETSSYRLEKLWTQIAERFKDYDQRLIFEGFNELIDSNRSWDSTSLENYEVTNQLNQLFVDTVRASGGYNEERILIVNLYAATPSASNISNFTVPTDTVEDRIIVGMHTYEDDADELESIFEMLDEAFVSEGIPVILGEFGSTNSSGSLTERAALAKTVAGLASELNIPYFWWDDGGTASSYIYVTNYALLNRTTCNWYFPNIVEALTGVHPSGDTSDTTVDGPQLADGITQVGSIEIGATKGKFETDITMTEDDSYEFTFSLPTTTAYGYPLNVVVGSRTCFMIRQETTDLIVAYGYQRFTAGTITAGETYTVSQVGTTIYLNGTKLRTTPEQTFSDGTVTIGSGSMSFYGMTITRDGEIVHNLLPAVDSDLFACIYDTVTDTVYYPASQSYVSFTALENWEDEDGEDIGDTEDTGDTEDSGNTDDGEDTGDSGDTGSTGESEDTKDSSDDEDLGDFTLVESLEVDAVSAQFVTDIEMSLDDDYEVIFALANTTGYGYVVNAVCGSRTCYMVRQETTSLITAYGYQKFTAGTIVAGEKYTVKQTGETLYLNGVKLRTMPMQDFSDGTLTLCQCKMSFYGMTITRDGEVVHNLVPALDKVGVPCIYDKVTGKAYYSAKQSYISYVELETSGDTEDTGNTGNTEDNGNTGDTGDTGDTKDNGDTGDTGDSGDTEDTGDTGNTEDTEDTGDAGDTSDTGDMGDFTLVESLEINAVSAQFVTDIEMGLDDDYEITFALTNMTGYGYVINAVSGSRTCYMIRQETTSLITAYGYQRFTAGTVVAGEKYTVTQTGETLYLNGAKLRTMPVQDFSDGTLTLCQCRMSFYGMTITRDGEVVHNLVPALDPDGLPCIYDKVTGTAYYSAKPSYISYVKL